MAHRPADCCCACAHARCTPSAAQSTVAGAGSSLWLFSITAYRSDLPPPAGRTIARSQQHTAQQQVQTQA